MKGKFSEYWIRITGWVMNLIMFGMLVNYALFTHAHVLYDGTTLSVNPKNRIRADHISILLWNYSCCRTCRSFSLSPCSQ